MMDNHASKAATVLNGSLVSQRASAPASLDLSASEFGCGGPDTYLASLIAEGCRVRQAEAPSTSTGAIRSAKPTFDPWEAAHD